MGGLQPWHIIVIVVVFLVLFGGKKLPDAARGLGRSLRILKSEVGAMHEEDAKPKVSSETDVSSTVPTAASQIAPAPIVGPTVQVPGAGPVAAPPVYGSTPAAPVAPVYAAPAYSPPSPPVYGAPVANGQPAPIAVPAQINQPVINVPMNGQHTS